VTVSISWGYTNPSTNQPAPVIGDTLPAQTTNVDAVVLGSGLLQPFRRDAKGDWAHGSDADLLKSNLEQVLGTVASSNFTVGELPWRPEFGSLLYLLRHRNNDAVLAELARQYVVDAVQVWEPRIRVKQADVTQDLTTGVLEIFVLYDILNRARTVVATNLKLTFTTGAA
jgi:phage baseplate assembly protein W